MYVFAESVPNTQGYCDVHYVGESTPTMEAHRERHREFEGNIFFLQMMAYTYYSQREVYGTTMSLGHFPLMTAYSQRDPEGEALWFRYFQDYGAKCHSRERMSTGAWKSPVEGVPEKDIIVTAFVNSSCYIVISYFRKLETRRSASDAENLETGTKAARYVPSRIWLYRDCGDFPALLQRMDDRLCKQAPAPRQNHAENMLLTKLHRNLVVTH